MAKKTKLEKALHMMMKLQSKKYSRKILSGYVKQVINWTDNFDIDSKHLFDMTNDFLSKDTKAIIKDIKRFKKGKDIKMKMALIIFRKWIKDVEFRNDLISAAAELEKYWNSSRERDLMTFVERFAKCIATEGYCELKAAVRKVVANVVGQEVKEHI